MGSGRDKRKKKNHVPGAGAVRTAQHTERNANKQERRVEKKAQGGEDDLDALLARFKLQDAASTEVQIIECSRPPSPRLFATFTPVPSGQGMDIIMHGGEYFDGATDKTHVYGDLFVYSITQAAWKQVSIPGGPSPRSAHQAVFHKGYIYSWGGELTSPNQEKFKHYRELWRLHVATWAWEQLPGKGGPNGRSGHRMALHGSKLLIFGGFNDSGKSTTYYNDVWTYDIPTLSWQSLKAGTGTAPAPRGGSQIVLHDGALFVFGGHTAWTDADKAEHEKVHDDVWRLDLASSQWTKVKRAGLAPSPPRSSFGMGHWKQSAFLFGGVTDRLGKKDAMYSELHNELYQFNLSACRWFPVSMRAPKGQAKQKAKGEEAAAEAAVSDAAASASDAVPDKSSALYKAAVRIQASYRGYAVRKAIKTYQLGGKLSELLYSPATLHGVDMSSGDLKPRARVKPMITVCGNTLYMYGGSVEIAHTDVTLDDVWSLDLAKLDGWHCLAANSAGEDVFEPEPGWETDEDASADEGEQSDE